jgi:hypothetical protein
VNIASAGNYDFVVRAASPNAGVTFHIEMNGVNVTGTQSIPNTGGIRNDVLAALPPTRPLAYTSVATILRILEQKHVLKHEPKRRRGVQR